MKAPYHHAKCTPAQKEAAKQAASNAGLEVSAFIREAIDLHCAAHGVDYPHDLPERGKYDRSRIDWQKLAGDKS